MGGEVALRIDALVLFLEVNPFQVQRLDRLFFVRRHFARNPSEGLRRAQF